MLWSRINTVTPPHCCNGFGLLRTRFPLLTNDERVVCRQRSSVRHFPDRFASKAAQLGSSGSEFLYKEISQICFVLQNWARQPHRSY
jgi:hypothetical protein